MVEFNGVFKMTTTIGTSNTSVTIDVHVRKLSRCRTLRALSCSHPLFAKVGERVLEAMG